MAEPLTREDGIRLVDLDITGMTCASCVGRVERKLGKICLLYTSPSPRDRG